MTEYAATSTVPTPRFGAGSEWIVAPARTELRRWRPSPPRRPLSAARWTATRLVEAAVERIEQLAGLVDVHLDLIPLRLQASRTAWCPFDRGAELVSSPVRLLRRELGSAGPTPLNGSDHDPLIHLSASLRSRSIASAYRSNRARGAPEPQERG
jgi:hypothetical protein